MLEKDFQKELIQDLKKRFPGAVVYKNETKQGIPDLTVLYRDHWAWLECKKSETASHQPNQDYYVDLGNSMSFARFVYPENKGDVLNALEQTFRSHRKTRVSKPE